MHDRGSTPQWDWWFSLRHLFIFGGLTEHFWFIRDGKEWG